MKQNARGQTLRCIALACTLAISLAAHGQSREFDVAAGDLKAALDAYTTQAGVQLLYKVDDVKGLSTKGLKGALPPEEALSRLLEGTRLKLRREAGGAIVVYVPPPDAPKPRSEAAQLEGITVTATRRREPVREVPMQVNVLKSEALESRGDKILADYIADQPGIDLRHAGPTSGALSIRGLTTGNTTVPTVGVYVDDVATGSSAPYGVGPTTPLDMGLLDLNHIEILRGPQGTLYGAGAMGGLLKYVTNQPDTSGFDGSVKLGASSTQGGGIGYTASGVLNLPIKTDVAAVRIAAFHDHYGGYVDAVGAAPDQRINRGKAEGARISALLTPSKELSVRLTATTQEVRREGTEWEDVNPVTGEAIGAGRQRNLFAPEPYNMRTSLFGLDVEYDFGWARLNSITSAQDTAIHGVTDASPGYIAPLQALFGYAARSVGAVSIGDQHRISQEFRLTSRAGRDIEWLAGLYLNRERATQSGGVDATPATGPGIFNLLTTNVPTTYRETAAYGDLTWHATPALALTGGLRVGRNEQTYTNSSSGALVGPTPSSTSGNSADTATTYLATAAYALTSLSNVYFRAASGYRAGGPNNLLPTTSAAVPSLFKSDSLWSYELGYKANLLDRTLAVEAAVYDIEWKNIQQPLRDGNFSFFTNAGKARIRGAELSLNWTPVQAWRFDAALSTIDGHLLTDAVGIGAHAGDRLPLSARLSGALGATYRFDLGGREAYLGLNARYVGEREAGYPGSVVVRPFKLPASTVLGLQGGIEFQRFSLAAYVRNLANTRRLLSISANSATVSEAVFTEPRVVGMSVNAPF